MFFEDENKDYKMVAPDIDELIAYFDHIYMSSTKSTTNFWPSPASPRQARRT